MGGETLVYDYLRGKFVDGFDEWFDALMRRDNMTYPTIYKIIRFDFSLALKKLPIIYKTHEKVDPKELFMMHEVSQLLMRLWKYFQVTFDQFFDSNCFRFEYSDYLNFRRINSFIEHKDELALMAVKTYNKLVYENALIYFLEMIAKGKIRFDSRIDDIMRQVPRSMATFRILSTFTNKEHIISIRTSIEIGTTLRHVFFSKDISQTQFTELLYFYKQLKLKVRNPNLYEWSNSLETSIFNCLKIAKSRMTHSTYDKFMINAIEDNMIDEDDEINSYVNKQ
jgi:hypothetical protein